MVNDEHSFGNAASPVRRVPPGHEASRRRAATTAHTLWPAIAPISLVVLVVLSGCGSSDAVDVSRGESVPARSMPAVPSASGPGITSSTQESAAPSAVPTLAETDATPQGVIIDPAVLDGMLLHLPDVPEGARIGDDSQCGSGVSTEGGSDPFLDLVGETGGAIVGCLNQLEAPTLFVGSLVVAFPNDDVATRALAPAAFDGIIRYYALECCTNDAARSVAATTGPGLVGVEMTSVSDSMAIVGWRSGSLVGAISVVHLDGAAGALTKAHGLAALQHARMRAPVAVPDDVDDDRLVGLQAAPFPTWWLGEEFAPPGLTVATLRTTHYRDGMAELDYDGIRIEIFDLAAIPDGSEPAQILGVAADLFDSPCTVTVPVEHPGGAAALLGRAVPDDYFGPPAQSPGRTGWGALDGDDCPEGPPNLWMATVQFDDSLLLRVNAPLCYNCLAPPDPERPYHQPDGLRAVVAALAPYAG